MRRYSASARCRARPARAESQRTAGRAGCRRGRTDTGDALAPRRAALTVRPMELRNRDGSPWVWWVGGLRLILLAFASFFGFRYTFGLSWLGAGIAVGIAYGLAVLVWGTFAWMGATGRQIPIPKRLLLRAARKRARG